MQELVCYTIQFSLIVKAKFILVIGFLRFLPDIVDKVPVFDTDLSMDYQLRLSPLFL